MVETMSTYHADVSRDGKFWLIHVPEVGRWTQARTYDEIEVMARDLVAIINDVPVDSFELAVSITLPTPAAEHLKQADQLRDQAATAQSEAANELRAAARALRDTGMSIRDLGKTLGVSHQRAHQLVHDRYRAG